MMTHPQQLKGLIAESWLHAVLDCGASQTVCGLVWLNNYIECLSEEDRRKIVYARIKNSFGFGDGQLVQSEQTVTLPAIIGKPQ